MDKKGRVVVYIGPSQVECGPVGGASVFSPIDGSIELTSRDQLAIAAQLKSSGE